MMSLTQTEDPGHFDRRILCLFFITKAHETIAV